MRNCVEDHNYYQIIFIDGPLRSIKVGAIIRLASDPNKINNTYAQLCLELNFRNTNFSEINLKGE